MTTKTAVEKSQRSTIETEATVETFATLVRAGIELWAQAGQVLLRLVEKNPNVYAEIMRKHSFITFEMLLAFERMGRKQIYPPLLMDNSPGAQRLLEMPYEVQEKLSREQIEVVTDASNGAPKTAKKYIKELNSYEAKMVFAEGKVRTVLEQSEFAKTHGKQGRKKHVKSESMLGTYVLKVSPSGSVVAERCEEKIMCPTVTLHEKDGIRQAYINIMGL